MKTFLMHYFIVLSLLITFLGCATGEPTGKTGKTKPPVVFEHKTNQDTVDWRTVVGEGKPLRTKETDLEWLGEKMGLIGPIVAVGGSGSKRYVLVYDPAGVLVGGLTRKEVKKNPERLEKLVRRAHERGEVQNLHALQFMAARKIQAQMVAAAEKGTP
jgi:hypothetical protein